jgi:hypothetical protein
MKLGLIQSLVVVAGAVVGGTAYASIPDANGVIHGCYNAVSGATRIIDPALSTCTIHEKSLKWEQTGKQGPQGATGAAGAAGAPGAPGQSVVGQSVGVGDPNCPSGGAMFSLGGAVTYVCNGAAGASGPMGPQGVPGLQGPPGAQGTPGVAGTQGPPGANGAPGPAGPTGAAGPQGPTGPTGADPRFGTNLYPFSGGPVMNGCIIGQVWLFAGEVGGGTAAEGQILNIADNQALFALLGTMYGGDGQTTFALPDLRNAAPNGLRYAICTLGIFPSRN